MDKVLTFPSVDPLGEHFVEAIDVTRKGGGLQKVAGSLHPELQAYLRQLRPDPKYQFVLMAPMGSLEFWGPNVNGDGFPTLSLSHDHLSTPAGDVARQLEEKFLRPFGKTLPAGDYREFGHKTFLKAHRYRHHVNKNPEIAYGDITFVIWNPEMSRVELVTRHDREKAKRVGAEEIIRDIDQGKPRQISMGCKVPWDLCSICGHISKTTSDYCSHLRSMMGQVLGDGRVVCAYNLFPRFFDLSDVIIPAAKESGVLMKVASARRQQLITFGRSLAPEATKRAEVKKTVLPNAGQEVARHCAHSDKPIPKAILSARGVGLHSLMSTLAMLGIALRPREFQYSALHHMGKGGLADVLDRRGEVFRVERPRYGSSFRGEDFSPRLAEMLSSLLEDRSGFTPHLPRRVMKIIVIKAQPPDSGPVRVAPESGDLKKVAAAYSAYTGAFRTLPRALDVAMSHHPGYYQEHFFGELLEDAMVKRASTRIPTFLSEPLVPVYLYSVLDQEVMSGPDLDLSPLSPSRALFAPTL